MEIYGVEIVGKAAYTELINRSQTAYGKQRNDFEGTKEACIEYMKKNDVNEIIGVLKETL